VSYFFDRANWPSLKAPPQLLVPEYVPVIPDEDAVADPVRVTVHVDCPDTPPAGTAIENVRLVPVSVPVSVPLNALTLDVVPAATLPATAVPFWVRLHVIVPGPDESIAFPTYVPLSVIVGGVGGVGVGAEGELEPLPQATLHANTQTQAMLPMTRPAHPITEE
jgi:hypothetical protein